MTLFGFNVGTFFNDQTAQAQEMADQVYGFAAIISIIGVIITIVQWACVIIFIVSLILYFVKGSNIKKAEDEMRKQERLLKRLNKRENPDEDDLSDTEEDLELAQEAYDQAVIARSQHAKRCRICVVWWIICFLITILMVKFAYKWGMDAANSISDSMTFGNAGTDTLQTLGGEDDYQHVLGGSDNSSDNKTDFERYNPGSSLKDMYDIYSYNRNIKPEDVRISRIDSRNAVYDADNNLLGFLDSNDYFYHSDGSLYFKLISRTPDGGLIWNNDDGLSYDIDNQGYIYEK